MRTITPTLRCLAAVACAVFSHSGHAQRADDDAPNLPSAAAQLKRAYEQASERAIQPIRARYVADLKRLLDQETRSGRLEQAAAIKQELETLPGGTIPGGTNTSDDSVAEFEKRFVGLKWVWNGSYNMSFEWGGKTEGRHFSWKSIGPYKVEYRFPEGNHGTITFNRNLTNGTIKETTPDSKTRTLKIERMK